MISIEYLNECLVFNYKTGALIWRNRPIAHFPSVRGANQTNAKLAGKEVTCKDASGYIVCRINKQLYKAHRICWALYYDKWPTLELDHINGDVADNRIENLREVSHKENGRNQKKPCNNTSGYCGVSLYRDGRWRAYISVDGSFKHLGYFLDKKEAHQAVLTAQAENNYHPNHERV